MTMYHSLSEATRGEAADGKLIVKGKTARKVARAALKAAAKRNRGKG